jgi:hypothetical protein
VKVLKDEWALVKGITWVTKHKHSELALAHVTYGNNAELNWHYGELPSMSSKIGDLISWSSFCRYPCGDSALDGKPWRSCTIDGGNG